MSEIITQQSLSSTPPEIRVEPPLNVLDLPPEILERVFSNICKEERIRVLARVCNYFREVVIGMTWPAVAVHNIRRLKIDPKGRPKELEKFIKEMFSPWRLGSLKIRQHPDHELCSVNLSAPAFHFLRTLHLSIRKPVDISALPHNLRVLSIKSYGFDRRTFIKIKLDKLPPHLRSLTLYGVELDRIPETPKTLTTISLSYVMCEKICDSVTAAARTVKMSNNFCPPPQKDRQYMRLRDRDNLKFVITDGKIENVTCGTAHLRKGGRMFGQCNFNKLQFHVSAWNPSVELGHVLAAAVNGSFDLSQLPLMFPKGVEHLILRGGGEDASWTGDAGEDFAVKKLTLVNPVFEFDDPERLPRAHTLEIRNTDWLDLISLKRIARCENVIMFRCDVRCKVPDEVKRIAFIECDLENFSIINFIGIGSEVERVIFVACDGLRSDDLDEKMVNPHTDEPISWEIRPDAAEKITPGTFMW